MRICRRGGPMCPPLRCDQACFLKSISKTSPLDRLFEMKFKNFRDESHKNPAAGPNETGPAAGFFMFNFLRVPLCLRAFVVALNLCFSAAGRRGGYRTSTDVMLLLRLSSSSIVPGSEGWCVIASSSRYQPPAPSEVSWLSPMGW